MFCVDEAKLDANFPNSQFILKNFKFPAFRRDQNSKGGGKLVSIKQRIITKRLENLETKFSKNICVELTLSQKKWCAYRPPKQNKTWSKVWWKQSFYDLKDTYTLSNLVKSATCFKSSKGTLLDVLLTNKPKSFQKTFLCEIGLSDCHKLVATIFR